MLKYQFKVNLEVLENEQEYLTVHFAEGDRSGSWLIPRFQKVLERKGLEEIFYQIITAVRC